MAWWLKVSVLQFLLFISPQAFEIVSNPPENAEGVVQVALDGTVSLTCLSGTGAGQTDVGELLWLRNGLPVSLVEGSQRGNSSLCVSPTTRQDHTATFTCQSRGDASINASVSLSVTYAPELSGKEEVNVEEEGELVLQCAVEANPPVSVSWWKDGVLLDLTLGHFLLSSDGATSRLSVARAHRASHQGGYRCLALSALHGTFSKDYQVTILDKTLKFPLMPLVAGLVVVLCTSLLAVVSRWSRIVKCCTS